MNVNQWDRLGKTVVWILFPALCGVCMAADPFEEKLDDLKTKREKISTLHMTATSTSRSESGTRESKIESWEKNSDGIQKYRRQVTSKVDSAMAEDQAGANTLIVKDGQTAWRETVIPGKTLVLKSKANPHTEYDDLKKLLAKGTGKFHETQPLLDQPCVLLEIRDKKKADDVLASYWISERYGIVLKNVIKNANGSTTDMKVTEFKVDVEIRDSLFSYQPPEGAQVYDEKMGKLP